MNKPKQTKTASSKASVAKKTTRSRRKNTRRIVNNPIFQISAEDASKIPYLLSDAADDQQILAEINGQISDIADELVYCFTDKNGRQITGLSWIGVKSASFYLRRKKMLNLSVEDVVYEQDPQDKNYYIFKAKVKDLISGAVSIGIKRQCTKIRLKNGDAINNEFWVEQGRTKAIRNAMSDLMPTDWIARQVKEWIKKGQYKVLSEQPRVVDSPSLDKIKPFVDELNQAKTKEELKKIEGKIIANKDLTGKEKYALRQMIAGRAKRI